MLIWRLILEEYGPDIEYIEGDKNRVAYALLILSTKLNQETTQESTYKNEIMTEINGTK